MPDEDDTTSDELMTAVARVRATLEGTRSDRLLRLFDYLLEKSLDNESSSEQQIAADVFNGDRSPDGGSDANVRVYIHRLRKVMETAFAGTQGARLHIPVGEYRILLIKAGEVEAPRDGFSSKVPIQRKPAGWWTRASIIVAASLAITGLAWMWIDHGKAPLADTPAWQTIAESRRPITVVVGDYYLFARIDHKPEAKGQPPQLVLDQSVPTPEDLIIAQMLEPNKADDVADYNQQFVSGGTIEALSTVRAGFVQLPSLAHRRINLVAASQLTPETLASSDLVYIGQFSGIAQLLRDPLMQASGFTFDPGFGGLTDKKSAARYKSDGMTLTDERIAKRDFAYLANVPGPAGNRILMVAGIGDAGVREAAQIAMNQKEMSQLSPNPSGPANGFEALYRVRTIKNVNVGARLVVNRPLRSGGIWDNSGNVPAYRPLGGTTNDTADR